MKRPKLPKKVHFVDENGVTLKEKDAWKALCEPHQEIILRLAIRGTQREFRLRRGEIVRILFGNNLENFQHFEEPFEEDLAEFVHAAIWWAKDEQRAKERRAIVFRRLRVFPETNRVMSPVRFKRGAGTSRLF